MKLEIEYPMILDAVPPRSVNTRTCIVMDVTTIDIPEYSERDAPIAIQTRSTKADAGMMVRRYRSANGDLFLEATAPQLTAGRCTYELSFDDETKHSPIFHGELQPKVVKLIRNKCFYVSAAKSVLYPEEVIKTFSSHRNSYEGDITPALTLPLLDEVRFAKIDESQISSAREAFRERLSGVILIDGTFHIRQPEPVYVAWALPPGPSVGGGYPLPRERLARNSGQLQTPGSCVKHVGNRRDHR